MSLSNSELSPVFGWGKAWGKGGKPPLKVGLNASLGGKPSANRRTLFASAYTFQQLYAFLSEVESSVVEDFNNPSPDALESPILLGGVFAVLDLGPEVLQEVVHRPSPIRTLAGVGQRGVVLWEVELKGGFHGSGAGSGISPVNERHSLESCRTTPTILQDRESNPESRLMRPA